MTEEKKDSNFNLETFLLFILVFLAAAVLIVLIALFNQSNYPQSGRGWQGNATATLLKLPPTWTPVPSVTPISVSNSLTRCFLNSGDLPFYMEQLEEDNSLFENSQSGARQLFVRNFSTKKELQDFGRPTGIIQSVAEFTSVQAAKTGFVFFESLNAENLLRSDALKGRGIPTKADEVKLFVGLSKQGGSLIDLYDIRLIFRQGKVVNSIYMVIPFDPDDPDVAKIALHQVLSMEDYAQKIADRCE